MLPLLLLLLAAAATILRAGAQKALPRRASVSQAHSSDMLSGTELKEVNNPDSFSVPELKGVDANTGGQIGNGKVPRTQQDSCGKPPHVDPRTPRDVELIVRHPEISEKVSPTTNVDRLVMAVVVAGIVAFATFQISESVAAHENPSTKSTSELLPRTFPGLMICPYSFHQEYSSQCPRWSSDALLKFAIGENPAYTYPEFGNNNQHSASQRTQAKCPNNHASISSDSQIGNHLLFGHVTPKPNRISTPFHQKIIVQNTAVPTQRCTSDNDFCRDPAKTGTFPTLCPSWTPPNVECTVFDPHHFDKQAKQYGMDPACNPMKEIESNTLDLVFFRIPLFTSQQSDDQRTIGYTYSGLIPEQSSSNLQKLPPEFFMSSRKLILEKNGSPYNSLFAGVVAVLYDASKGVPKKLNFDRAADNTMSTDILISTVLLQTNCGQPDSTSSVTPATCRQERLPAVDVLTTIKRDRKFSNRVAGTFFNETSYTTFKQQAPPRSYCHYFMPVECVAGLRIFFTSPSSVVDTQVISLSILTTISIIVSTGATLWGSQAKIKDGIDQVKTKFFTKKKEADVGNRALA